MKTYFKNKRYRIVINEAELKAPREFIKKSLLRKSSAKNFEEAKQEWIIEKAIDDTSDDFSSRCELCNHNGLVYNFIIYNPITNQYLRVGSSCIVRFGVGKGIVDLESGKTLLQNIIDDQYYVNKIRALVPSVMVLTPNAKDVKEFYESLKSLLSLRGIKKPTIEQLKEIAWGERAANITNLMLIGRLQMLWEKPGQIETVKEKIRKEKTYQEHTTFGYKRRTRVSTTLGYSSVYKDPQKKYT